MNQHHNNSTKKTSKRDTIIFWAATIFIFLFEAAMPLGTLLFAPEQFNAGTKPLGYPDYFAYTLIVCKVIGGSALLFPKLNATVKEWAYAGLTFNLIFAAISHAVIDGNVGFVLMPVIIGAILAVSYFYAHKLRLNK